MSLIRKVVVFACLALFVVWVHFNYTEVAGDDVGLIRFVLGSVLAGLILVRWKNPAFSMSVSGWFMPAMTGVGTGMALVGMILDLKQFEWLGLVLLLVGCLLWALPRAHGRDVLFSLFVVYWIHPVHAGAVAGLEGAMQRLSVQGSEWLLHCLDRCAWADGTDLVTRAMVFSVPPECSGLLTAMTVLVCTLGTGLLLRLRWFEIPVFMVLGIVQVLVLNILRVTLMVRFAPSQGTGWSREFLHDSLGMFLFAAIVLVQIEASWWRVRTGRRKQEQEGIDAGVVEPPDKASTLLHFWLLFKRFYKPILLVAVAVLGMVYAVYKQRPAHRASMIGGIVEDHGKIDPVRAQRAVDVALALAPDRAEFHIQRFRILMLRKRFAAALTQYETHLEGTATVPDKVLKSWALVGVDREDDALALVESLPELFKRSPQVAIVRAQYAVRKDIPRMVAENVVVASRSHMTAGRVRELYPYLAVREQWDTIVASDNKRVPYQKPVSALVLAQAYIRVGDMAGAGRVLEQAIRAWPEDPRFLSSLLMLAARRPGSQWEALFEAGFRRMLSQLDVNRLASYIDECFQIDRPDLAWLAYTALQQRAPGDPALLLAPAQHGGRWFTFRRREIGMRAEHEDSTVDLSVFCSRTRQLWPIDGLWARVPLADELTGDDINRVRSAYAKRCLKVLMEREEEGPLELRLAQMVPVALAMQGRYKEAHKRLEAMAVACPKERRGIFLQQARLHAQERQWQACYEKLREHSVTDPFRDLGADMMMIGALMNMGMGLAAMDTLVQTEARFPDTEAVGVVRAAIWQAFGHADEALFVLNAESGTQASGDVVQLLMDVGRLREAAVLARSLGMVMKASPKRQAIMLSPAEDVLKGRWPPVLQAQERVAVLGRLAEAQHKAASPFIRGLRGLETEWVKTGGGQAVRDPGRWQAIGRDAREQASALHRLALLSGCSGRTDSALAAVRLALKDMPTSAVLWRMAIALTGGDADTVQQARARCPEDAHVWLASLVVRLREVTSERPASRDLADWVAKEISDQRGKVPVSTMVRAGDLLLRKGLKDSAAVAIRYAIDKAPGYVPALFQGIRCALALQDARWMLRCALGGSDHAQDATPFLKLIVMLKSTGNRLDADMFKALERLVSRVPKEMYWRERLASAYFHKGNVRRALSLLAPLINADARGMHVHSLLVAAEAARHEGRRPEAIAILEKALLLYPKEASVLNNLVYMLAQEPRTLRRANRLLPQLTKQAARSPALLDTVAWVHFKSGRPEAARKEMERAVKLLDATAYAVPEMLLNSAEILMRVGRHAVARDRIESVQAHPRCTSMDYRRAAALLDRIPKDGR